jgi:hypothetical protein
MFGKIFFPSAFAPAISKIVIYNLNKLQEYNKKIEFRQFVGNSKIKIHLFLCVRLFPVADYVGGCSLCSGTGGKG